MSEARDRYSLKWVDERLMKAQAQWSAGQSADAFFSVLLAVAQLTDHVAAKERGDI